MTWFELMMFLNERGEKILEHRANEILTTQYRYYRVKSLWTKDIEDGALDIAYTRGGSHYVWRKNVEPDIVPDLSVIVNDEVMATST